MSANPITIVFKKKGTILIEGAVIVRDEDGNTITLPPKHIGLLKLCGCGKSLEKPFCDGSHKSAVAGQ